MCDACMSHARSSFIHPHKRGRLPCLALQALHAPCCRPRPQTLGTQLAQLGTCNRPHPRHPTPHAKSGPLAPDVHRPPLLYSGDVIASLDALRRDVLGNYQALCSALGDAPRDDICGGALPAAAALGIDLPAVRPAAVLAGQGGVGQALVTSSVGPGSSGCQPRPGGSGRGGGHGGGVSAGGLGPLGIAGVGAGGSSLDTTPLRALSAATTSYGGGRGGPRGLLGQGGGAGGGWLAAGRWPWLQPGVASMAAVSAALPRVAPLAGYSRPQVRGLRAKAWSTGME